MALNTVSIAAPSWYTLNGQEDDPEPAQFLLNGLNGYQKSQIHGEVVYNQDLETLTYTARGMLFLLSAGMTGWRNINHNAEPIEFSADMTQNMMIIDIDIQVQLVTEILLRSDLTGEERKNSPSQSKSEEKQRTSTAKPAKQDTAT